MGLREYLRGQGRGSRMKASAGVAFVFHAVVFLAGSLGLATQAEYGMSGSVASQPASKAVPPVELEMTYLSEDDASEPVKKRPEPTPVPTPEIPAQPASSPATASSQAYQIPFYFKNPPPGYPAEALKLKQEGAVLLRVEVGAKGQVVSVNLRQSSGFPLLDEAAQKTVSSWRFKPARLAGIAVSTQVDIPIRFRLKDVKS